MEDGVGVDEAIATIVKSGAVLILFLVEDGVGGKKNNVEKEVKTTS